MKNYIKYFVVCLLLSPTLCAGSVDEVKDLFKEFYDKGERNWANGRAPYDELVAKIQAAIHEIDVHGPRNADDQFDVEVEFASLHYMLGKLHNDFVAYARELICSQEIREKSYVALNIALKRMPKELGEHVIFAQIYFELIRYYCSMPNPENLTHARAYLRKINKKLFNTYYVVGKAVIDLQEGQYHEQQPHGKVHERLRSKIGILRSGARDEFADVYKKNNIDDIKRLVLEHNSLVRNNHNNFKLISESVIELEEKIASKYKFSLDQDLKNIYQEYKIILCDASDEIFSQVMLIFISAFQANGDIESAKVRTDVLLSIYPDDDSLLSNTIRAKVALMHGDMKPWLALEQRYAVKPNKKKKKKKRELPPEQIAQIKSTQQQALVAPVPVPAVPKARESVVGHDYDPEEKFFPPHNYRQEKLDKTRRHKARLAEREEIPDLEELVVQEEKSLDVQPQVIELEQDLRITDYFKLRGRALKVDRKIEGSDWKIKRDQIVAYFEALGCTTKMGNGSHQKSSLPKSVHIMRDEELLKILVELGGGALTWPTWEDIVPFYLRKDILDARQAIIQRVISAQ